MNNFAMPTLLAAFLSFTAIADAAAWTRSGSITGPRGGTSSVQGSGACAYGGCSSQSTRTLPGGGVISRSSASNCGGGACTRNSRIVGPGGRAFQRTGTISR